MKKKMILVTSSFPFSIKEASFLRPEIEALHKEYDVTIVSRNTSDEQNTVLPEDIKIYRYNPNANLNYPVLLIKTLFSHLFYKEIGLLIKTKRMSKKNFKSLVRFYTRSLHFAEYLKRIRAQINEDTILYTYWNDYAVMSLSLIKRKGDKLVSRMHRIDLYEREGNGFYLPMKAYSNRKTDLLVAICDEGKEYYEKTFGKADNIKVFRLGTEGQQKRKNNEKNYLSIYSLSYITPVKRVELIPRILSQINGVSVHWTHIGSGIDEEKVKDETKRLLSGKENIVYSFVGALDNKDAMQLVSESDFDLLVNTSSSEGLPVTMMEAMSFGIPVIGTDVGGVREIIENGKNGWLIKDDDRLVDSFKNVLIDYYYLSDEEKKQLSQNAFDSWKNKYNIRNNLESFINEIKSL